MFLVTIKNGEIIMIMTPRFFLKRRDKLSAHTHRHSSSKVSHSISCDMCRLICFFVVAAKTFFWKHRSVVKSPQEPKKFNAKLLTWKQSQCFVKDCWHDTKRQTYICFELCKILFIIMQEVWNNIWTKMN